MIINQRFFVNEERYIIDRANWANNGLVEVPEGFPEDWQKLRENLSSERIHRLLDGLKTSLAVNKKRRDKELDNLRWALSSVVDAIGSTNTTRRDVELRYHEKFDGRLRRDRSAIQDLTSLSLFVDDVERLLRDLYGYLDEEVTERVRKAIFQTMRVTMKRCFSDLWEEYDNARTFDHWFVGIGAIPGYLDSTDHWRADKAGDEIAVRACAIRARPALFSKYTVEFVKRLEKRWPKLARSAERRRK